SDRTYTQWLARLGDGRLLGGHTLAESLLELGRTGAAASAAAALGRWCIATGAVATGLRLERDALGAADERRVELVDVTDMLERSGQVGSHRLALRWPRRRLANWTRSSLSGALAVTGHSCAPALASLPVAGVTTAPATVLAQRHPVRVVALALVRLV